MPTMSDLLKIVVHAKIVPDAEPNADGEWITLSVKESDISPKTNWYHLSAIAPKGFHVVSVRL